MDEVTAYGQRTVSLKQDKKIKVFTIIGEIEGHDVLSGSTKTTKYEHLIPQLIEADYDEEIQGMFFVLNTIGGDVESGLAIAELIASLKKPTISLVIGGSHSIGIPLAVATKYSFIVPSATMMVHPVRMSGTVVGAPQTYYQFYQMQERIVSFVTKQTHMKKEVFEKMMLAKDMLAKDLGTILVGKEAVDVGLIQEEGGLEKAIKKMEEMLGI